MSTPHRATPEQWAVTERWAAEMLPYYSCILELRDRLAAAEQRISELEAGAACPHVVSSDEGTSYCGLAEQTANSQPTPNDRQIRSSLVRCVAFAISRCKDSAAWDDDAFYWAPEARAAIRAVANAVRSRDLNGQSIAVMTWEGVARWLEQEVERHG